MSVPCWWWLSFARDTGFLGVAIVRAPSFTAAVMETHRLRCNPGGEAAGWPCPEHLRVGDPPERFRERLLDKAEAETAAREWDDSPLVRERFARGRGDRRVEWGGGSGSHRAAPGAIAIPRSAPDPVTAPPGADAQRRSTTPDLLVGARRVGERSLWWPLSSHADWRHLPADQRGVILADQLLEADAVAELDRQLALLIGVQRGQPVDAPTSMGGHCRGPDPPPAPLRSNVIALTSKRNRQGGPHRMTITATSCRITALL